MEVKKIIRSASYILVAKIFSSLLGIVKNKLNALFIGTHGIGLYNQVMYLNTFLANMTQLGMVDGVVKLLSGNDSENKKQIIKNALTTYFYILFALLFLIFTIAIIFRFQFTIYLFGENKYIALFFFSLITFPFITLNSIPFSIFKSFKSTSIIARSQIIASFLAIIFYIPLIFLLNLRGAIFSILLSNIFLLICNFVFLKKKVLSNFNLTIYELLKGKIKKNVTKELFNFAIFSFGAGMLHMFLEIGSRTILITNLGIDKLGLYAPIISITGIIGGFLLPSINTYLYPRFCEIKKDIELNQILNDSLRILFYVIIFFIFSALVFGKLIIPLLFSNKFIDATIYLPYHLLGYSFYYIWSIFSIVLTPRGLIKLHGLLYASMAVFDFFVVFFLLPPLGLYAWMLKFILSPVLFSVIYFIIINQKFSFRFEKSNLILLVLFISGGIILTYLTYIQQTQFYIVILVYLCLLITAMLLLRKTEIEAIKSKIEKILFQK